MSHIIPTLPKGDLFTHEEINSFINGMVSQLEGDKFILSEGMASQETKEKYKVLMSKDENMLPAYARYTSSIHFLKKMIWDFTENLNEYGRSPLKLAFSISDTKLYAWAEIMDEDEETENALFLSEAKVNSKYYEFNFSVSTTIVEQADRLPVPRQYSQLTLHNQGNFSGNLS